MIILKASLNKIERENELDMIDGMIVDENDNYNRSATGERNWLIGC